MSQIAVIAVVSYLLLPLCNLFSFRGGNAVYLVLRPPGVKNRSFFPDLFCDFLIIKKINILKSKFQRFGAGVTLNFRTQNGGEVSEY